MALSFPPRMVTKGKSKLRTMRDSNKHGHALLGAADRQQGTNTITVKFHDNGTGAVPKESICKFAES